MNKKKNIFMKIVGLVNCLALVLVAQTANTACIWTFHQPEFPEAANRFKKLT